MSTICLHSAHALKDAHILRQLHSQRRYGQRHAKCSASAASLCQRYGHMTDNLAAG